MPTLLDAQIRVRGCWVATPNGGAQGSNGVQRGAVRLESAKGCSQAIVVGQSAARDAVRPAANGL